MKAKNCFTLTIALGDCILGSVAFRKLVRQTKQAWAWATIAPHLSIACEFTKEVVSLSEDLLRTPTLVNAQLGPVFSKIVHVTPAWHWKEWAKGDVYLMDLVARHAGVELEPEDRFIVLNPTEADRRVVSALLEDRHDYIVMSGSPHYNGIGLGDWPMHVRVALAEQLKQQGHELVIVGGPDAQNIGGYFLGGRTTYLQTVEVIKRAKLYIGNDCGTSWLACAAHNTPKIISSNFEPKPGKEGYAGCLSDTNIVDVDWRDSNDKILGIIRERRWL